MRTLHIRIHEPVQQPDSGDDRAPCRIQACLDHELQGEGVLDVTKLRNCTARLPEDRWDDQELMLQVGQQLFGLLSSGTLAQAWARRDDDTRIVLDVGPPWLRDLPWELLCDDEETWLFQSRVVPAVRARIPYTLKDVQPLQVPVRLLIVVGSLEDNLQVEDEIDEIYRGLRTAYSSWDVDVLYRPAEKTLIKHYHDVQPHVLHFIGHGKQQGAGRDARSALEVVDESGKDWSLTGGWARNALGHLRMPRLVVLNACRSNDQARKRTLWSVKEGFLHSGVSAVVSIQGDIETGAGVEFSSAFYTELATGAPVDLAVGRARYAIRYGRTNADWARPTLTVQTDPEMVLKLEQPAGNNSVQPPPGTRFEQARWLVDRSEERRNMARLVDPDSFEVPERNGELPVPGLALVGGPGQTGKSSLVKSYTLTRQLRGQPSVYVELPQGRKVNWSEFVQRVADAAQEYLGERATPVCDKFREAVRALEPDELRRSVAEAELQLHVCEPI